MKPTPRKAQIVDGRAVRPAAAGLELRCPKCGAAPGWRCTKDVAGMPRALKHPHRERAFPQVE